MSEANVTSWGCPIPARLASDPVPLFSNGNIKFKAHDVGWLVAAIFSCIATAASFWLIRKHLQFFCSPHQQRYIVRILLMVPIYAVSSLLSYLFYTNALYYQLMRDCYEALVISSFFNLLLEYLSSPPPSPDDPCPRPFETRAERKRQLDSVLRDVHVDKWVWPLGFVKWRCAGGGKGEGAAFLWLMRIGIGQYVVLRPLSTLLAVVSEAMGLYCVTSWSPKFMHIYTSIIVSLSVTIAMYCVLQLYWPLRKELEPHRPVLKFLSVKTVVFLTFWQETFFVFLETIHVIKDHEYWTAAEIVVGLGAMLSCFEMMVFGFVHVRAFTYLPYRALAEPLIPSTATTIAPQEDPEHDPKESASVQSPEVSILPLLTTSDKEQAQKSGPSRLARPPKQVVLKADGSPPRQQTRVWPALWKCIRLSDIARELAEEGRYVAKSKNFVEKMKEEDLERDRLEARREVFGSLRGHDTSKTVGTDNAEALILGSPSASRDRPAARRDSHNSPRHEGEMTQPLLPQHVSSSAPGQRCQSASFIPPSQRVAQGTQHLSISSPNQPRSKPQPKARRASQQPASTLPPIVSRGENSEDSQILDLVDFSTGVPPAHTIPATAGIADTGRARRQSDAQRPPRRFSLVDNPSWQSQREVDANQQFGASHVPTSIHSSRWIRAAEATAPAPSTPLTEFALARSNFRQERRERRSSAPAQPYYQQRPNVEHSDTQRSLPPGAAPPAASAGKGFVYEWY